MAIAADSSPPTGLPSAADWVAAGVAAASETSVTAATVVASAPVADVAAADSIITTADATAIAGWTLYSAWRRRRRRTMRRCQM